MINSGIYKILNKINGKFYIGSASDLHIRWVYHVRRLKLNDHHNKHLQSAWNKYGEDNFEFIVLEYIKNKEMLIEIENKYILELQSNNKNIGYNKRITASSNAGMKYSPDHIAKIVAANTGKKRSEEFKNYRREIFRHTEESKRKISEASKGRKLSDEAKRKVSVASKGHVVTEEMKRRISEANRGRVMTDTQRENMSRGRAKARLLRAQTKFKVSTDGWQNSFTNPFD